MIFQQFVLVTLGVLFLRDLCAYKFNWFFFSPVNLSYGNLMIRPARTTQDGWGGISPSPTLSQNCLCLSAVVDLWVYYTWNSLNFLDVNINFFFCIPLMFSTMVSSIVLFVPFFLLLLGFVLCVCWYSYSVSQVSEALCIFLHFRVDNLSDWTSWFLSFNSSQLRPSG